MFGAFLTVTIGLVLLAAFSFTDAALRGQPISPAEISLGLTLLACPALALSLRFFVRLPGVGTLLFVVLSIGLVGVLISQFWVFFISDLGPAAGADYMTWWVVIPFVLTGAFFGFFVVTYVAISHGTVRHRRLRSEIERAAGVVPPAVLQRRVHGDPGAGLEAATAYFGPVNVAIGQLGERVTATLLESLLEMPGVQIVHGLHFPGSRKADIDHAVIAGNRIAFIDTKLWTAATYVMDPSGTILENGRMNAHRQSNHSAAVEKMAALFPHAEVRGWVVIHPQTDDEFSVTTRGASSRTRLVDSASMLEEVGDWLSPNGDVLDLFMVAEVLEHRNW